MTVREFGRLDGDTVHEIGLTAPDGATASIVTLGAALRDLVVPLADGSPRRVVLGCETLAGYRDNPAHLGALVGRCANRVGGARFRLDGRDVRLAVNDAGRNTLHGGPDGFTTRNWTVAEASAAAVTLARVSPDGESGFPGRLDLACRYAFDGPSTLSLTVTATCDAPTPVNLASHAYFTLNDGADCRAHLLRLAADFHTPGDDTKVPTGAVLPVAGTAHDFRVARPIAEDFDDGYVLAGPPGEIVRAAEVTAPDGRLRLELDTDQPGLQLYTGQYLGETDAPVGGLRHRPRSAFCLEAQGLVDAPNKRHFPSVILRPGETYRHRTIWRFRAL